MASLRNGSLHLTVPHPLSHFLGLNGHQQDYYKLNICVPFIAEVLASKVVVLEWAFGGT